MSQNIPWTPRPLAADTRRLLAIKLKYLGDLVVAVPALRALRESLPKAELHVLAASDAAPALAHLPWIDQVWSLPRTRGKLRLRDTWPLLKALRALRFDASIDFVGNDRGALLSRLIGARRRLGPIAEGGFLGRARIGYNEYIDEPDTTRHQSLRDYYLLQAWNLPPPSSWELEVRPDPALAAEAAALLPATDRILCHLSTSQHKKEWPTSNWLDLHARLTEAGHRVCFSSGPSPREQALLTPFREAGLTCLPKAESFDLYIAVLARARALVSPDTAPVHLAAGLGVPTLSLFGPTASSCWAPLGQRHRSLQGSPCLCSGHWHTCRAATPCMAGLTPENVFESLTALLHP